MKRLLVILSVMVLTAATTYAQDKRNGGTDLGGPAAKSVYFELGGPGLASFNFDTRFSARQDGIGGRIGIGGFSIDGSSAIFVPIGLNYLLGKDGKNYFELGGGVTPVFVSDDLTDDDDNFTGTFGHLMFGYRLQPRNGGFTFRAFISPVFSGGFFLPYYGGVSFGYKF
jgi:hypothetical protein